MHQPESARVCPQCSILYISCASYEAGFTHPTQTKVSAANNTCVKFSNTLSLAIRLMYINSTLTLQDGASEEVNVTPRRMVLAPASGA